VGSTPFPFLLSGLSLEMGKDNLVDQCCGSPLYMAPEVIMRKRHNAVLSDIWSLGILFYYLLFADFPWLDVEDFEDLVDAILHDVISFPSKVGKEIISLLHTMLEVTSLSILNSSQS
jgi:non-specific serine/threonine protein kinase